LGDFSAPSFGNASCGRSHKIGFKVFVAELGTVNTSPWESVNPADFPGAGRRPFSPFLFVPVALNGSFGSLGLLHVP